MSREVELTRVLSSELLSRRLPIVSKGLKRPPRADRRVLEQHQTWLKPEQVQELVDAYVGGAPVRELAARFGTERRTVSAHLERNGIERRVNRAKLSSADIEQAAELYCAGLSLASVAERFDVDPKTSGTWLKRAGVAMRPRQGGLPAKTARASPTSNDAG